MRPAALLLDFGGVLGESKPGRTGLDRRAPLADRVHALVNGLVPLDQILADFHAAARAYGAWTDAMGRPFAPPELSHAEFWGDFVTADWPAPARARVLAAADELSYAWSDRGDAWRLRPGAADVVEAAHDAGIPLAVVSNILCGAAVRAFLDKVGIGRRFAAQIYSDELGARKPNPAMVHAATTALGVQPADCWFVGDQPLRDVLAARRAGVGHVVLVQSDLEPDEESRPVPSALTTPDVAVDSMVDVHRLLTGVV